MRTNYPKRGLQVLAGLALLALTGLSQAQYMWIDEKGLKQFSDRPPPPDTPEGKILKSPGPIKPAFALPPGAEPAATPSAATAPTTKGPPTLADKDAEFRQRIKDRADQERKDSEESQRRADMAANCRAARQSKAQLESGVPIRAPGASGNRDVMNDAQRAQELQKANQILASCQ